MVRAPAGRRRGLAAAVAAVAVVLTAGPVALAAGSPASPPGPLAGDAGVHEALVEPSCPVHVRPGHVTCFAMRRVVVPAGTPGAHPYLVRADGATTTGPAGGYTPADLASAYRFKPSLNRRHQLVAIVDAYNDPSARKDLEHFDAQYGLREFPGSFRQVNELGSAKRSKLPPHARHGWSVEESLDVQSVRAVCHTCRILLIEANNTNSDQLTRGVETAVRRGATEISNSYGGPEPRKVSSANQRFEKYADHKGIVVTASTGDFGWYGWNIANGGGAPMNAPEQPATLPGVVAVGGTTLTLTAAGTRSSETVWNGNGPNDVTGLSKSSIEAASGGGCSRAHQAPGWQRHVAGYPSTGCGGHRVDADVSAIANPMTGFDIYDSYSGDGQSPRGWATIGGTSLASPVVAAMWALAGGAKGVHPALDLYGHFSKQAGSFYDVRTGGNGFCDATTPASCAAAMAGLGVTASERHVLDCAFTNGGKARVRRYSCEARAGFDGPSGVGAPAGLSGFAPMSPGAAFHHSRARVHRRTTFTVHGSDPFPGGHIVRRVWRWGDGTHRSKGGRVRHVFARKGSYSVRVTVTDNYGRSRTARQRVVVTRH